MFFLGKNHCVQTVIFHSEERIKSLKNLNFPEFSACNTGMFNQFFQQNLITKTISLITNCTIMKYNPY